MYVATDTAVYFGTRCAVDVAKWILITLCGACYQLKPKSLLSITSITSITFNQANIY